MIYDKLILFQNQKEKRAAGYPAPQGELHLTWQEAYVGSRGRYAIRFENRVREWELMEEEYQKFREALDAVLPCIVGEDWIA